MSIHTAIASTGCPIWCATEHAPGVECTGEMTDIAVTGDRNAVTVDENGAHLPAVTVYLRELPDGQHTVAFSVTGPNGSVEVALAEWEAGRLSMALGERLCALDAARDLRAAS